MKMSAIFIWAVQFIVAGLIYRDLRADAKTTSQIG